MKIKQYYKNARVFVEQCKRGEWECYGENKIKRNDVTLWTSNGAWFFDIYKIAEMSKQNTRVFGFIFRHYAWWFGARRALKNEVYSLDTEYESNET